MTTKLKHTQIETHEALGVSKETYEEFQELSRQLVAILEKGQKNELFVRYYESALNSATHAKLVP